MIAERLERQVLADRQVLLMGGVIDDVPNVNDVDTTIEAWLAVDDNVDEIDSDRAVLLKALGVTSGD